MLVFALQETREFGLEVARQLGIELAPHEERSFEDGEHKARPLISVRGKDVYLIQSLHAGPEASANDRLCKLLFFISTLKENGAASVTALVPYLAYARKDRQTKPRDPVTTQYIARLMEAAGTDCAVTLDIHNIVAFQNAFRCRTVHLDTRALFSRVIGEMAGSGSVTVVSPDPGGVKRAQLFREMLEKRLQRPIGQAFVDKRRSAGVVSGELLIGEVQGSTAVVIDDLIASGGTMARAATAALQHGATDVIACAAHGLFTGNAGDTLASAPIRLTVVSDSVPPFRLATGIAAQHLKIVSAAPLFAGCIQCLAGGASITRLLGDED